jgi:hypothetical protein
MPFGALKLAHEGAVGVGCPARWPDVAKHLMPFGALKRDEEPGPEVQLAQQGRHVAKHLMPFGALKLGHRHGFHDLGVGSKAPNALRGTETRSSAMACSRWSQGQLVGHLA